MALIAPAIAGAAASNSAPAECLHGADGQPLIYPVPLFVRNTFIDYANARPPSLDEFVEERRVRSCPTSLVAGEALPAKEPERQEQQLRRTSLMGWWRNLMRSKTVGDTSATASVLDSDSDILLPIHVAKDGEKDQDARSECSTVDTAELSVPPPSAPGHAMSGQASHDGLITVLRLEESVAGPASPELPSVGSAGHHMGNCKPCAFFHNKGCQSGGSCPFCHLCDPGEKKRRQKEKRSFFSGMRQLQQFA
jgi:hypothetical protein